MKSNFPPGWDEERVKKVLQHYESQAEEEAVAFNTGGSVIVLFNCPEHPLPER